MIDLSTVTANKPHRTSEMKVGNTIFTVISVESDRARECLYDKVKRLILSHPTPPKTDPPAAA